MNNPKNLRSCVPYLAKVIGDGNLQYVNEDRVNFLVEIDRQFETGEEVVIHFDDSL